MRLCTHCNTFEQKTSQTQSMQNHNISRDSDEFKFATQNTRRHPAPGAGQGMNYCRQTRNQNTNAEVEKLSIVCNTITIQVLRFCEKSRLPVRTYSQEKSATPWHNALKSLFLKALSLSLRAYRKCSISSYSLILQKRTSELFQACQVKRAFFFIQNRFAFFIIQTALLQVFSE